MAYLMKIEEGEYRLFYSKPVMSYVVCPIIDTWWSLNDYLVHLYEEKDAYIYDLMCEYSVQEGPADVSEGNLGLPIETIVAEYLLQGKFIPEGACVELEVSYE